MKIATSQEMRNIDRRAIREFGIPGPVLMENAAAAVLAEMERFFDGLGGVKIGIVCGRGNNGGDGFALARRLRVRGIAVRVALLAPFSAVAGDAKLNLSILRRMDVEVMPNASARRLSELLEWSDIVLDAIIGVGLSAPLRGALAQAVAMINGSGRPVVSVDIPTGINADTGAIMGSSVNADLTVTLCLPKRGLVLHPGAGHAGTVRVSDIGIPAEAIDREGIAVSSLDRGSVWGLLCRRPPDSHKGEYGHLMVLAGSPGKTGAAVMAAKGALRAGAGIVSVAAPAGLVPIVQQQVAEAMCVPAAESIDGTLGAGAEEELLRAALGMSACAVGPGLSRHSETASVVRGFLRRCSIPMVVDADALNAVAGATDVLERLKAPAVLTPHPGEMARLLRTTADEVQKDRIGAAAGFAKRFRVVLVLKGSGTVVAAPSGEVFVNTTGNAGMATAGSGDVLTGMIGSFLAQGYPAVQAACLGVFLHGRAGDLAAAETGEASLIAGDVIAKIPAAMRGIAEEFRST